MADKRMRLRAIVVSTKAALESLPSASKRIRGASDSLLAELEADTRNDGADPELLRDIAAARQHVRDADAAGNGTSSLGTPQPPAAHEVHMDVDMTHDASVPDKHPDSPGGESVEEAVNEPTRESLETLGRPDLDDSPDPRAQEGDDRESPPGQNSDWTPQ